ncbi:hypothetical protein MKJ04_01520 [Pontibacter sp. E15-1]|uniref:hypothetical protein n=1 Tax=Pontibacter sp. E15-1 TaxID=2919918 RepID=UPI001F4F233A|nr:hypothetical protein [Pontibacter sp. E15-1]MCJ8163501.1 hypothetical protein [Pontibacter sp. E15-1]
MEDFKLILYVLAAVAYFVFMQWRKAFNAPKGEQDQKEPPRPERRQQHPAKPVTSFEDILRELQPKLDQAEARGKKAVDRAREELTQRMPPLVTEATVIPRSPTKPDLVPRALSWEKPADAKRLAVLSEEHLQKKRFESYTKDKKNANRYASLLKNPTSVRDAVILTEIFNRKYT